MKMIGAGIYPSTIDVDVVQPVKPMTKLALRWRETGSGLWVATDRGAAADTYDTEFVIYGKETPLNDFIDAFEANRTSAFGVGTQQEVTFFDISPGEKLFGADVDYTQTVDGQANAVQATITSIAPRRQGSWKGFGATVRARSLSPSFTGSPSLPTLKPLVGYTGDATYTIRKMDTYDNTWHYIDRSADTGYFQAKYKLTVGDMANLRRYIATQRGSNCTVGGLASVDNPFGRRTTSYPLTVKIIEWRDLGPWDSACQHWQAEIRFAEVP